MLTRLQNTEHVMISNDRGHRHQATAERLAQQVGISGNVLMLKARVRPVRPSPDWISSAINRTPCRLVSSRTPAK